MTDFILFDWLDQLGRIWCFTLKKNLIFFPCINKVTNQSINQSINQYYLSWRQKLEYVVTVKLVKTQQYQINWKLTQNVG